MELDIRDARGEKITTFNQQLQQYGIVCKQCNKAYLYLRKFGCGDAFCQYCAASLGYFCPTCDSLLLHSSYCVGDFARAMGNYKIGFMLDGELVTDYGRF